MEKWRAQQSEMDYIVAKQRPEIVQQIQSWRIDTYYSALQMENDKAKEHLDAIKKANQQSQQKQNGSRTNRNRKF